MGAWLPAAGPSRWPASPRLQGEPWPSWPPDGIPVPVGRGGGGGVSALGAGAAEEGLSPTSTGIRGTRGKGLGRPLAPAGGVARGLMLARAGAPTTPTGAHTCAHTHAGVAEPTGRQTRLQGQGVAGSPAPLVLPTHPVLLTPLSQDPSQLRRFQEETDAEEGSDRPGRPGRERGAGARGAGRLSPRSPWEDASVTAAGASALAQGAPAGRCAHSRRSGRTRGGGVLGETLVGPHVELGSRWPPRPSAGSPCVASTAWCSVGVVSAPAHCAGADTVHLHAHLWVPTPPSSPGEGNGVRRSFFIHVDGACGPSTWPSVYGGAPVCDCPFNQENPPGCGLCGAGSPLRRTGREASLQTQPGKGSQPPAQHTRKGRCAGAAGSRAGATGPRVPHLQTLALPRASEPLGRRDGGRRLPPP